MVEISADVNGARVALNVHEDDTLVEVLREHLGLTGAVIGCGWGQCGACSVLVDDEPVTACTTPAADVHGRSVLTVEGLEDANGLHPMQEAFLRHGALQCGYCTPGMLIVAVAAVNRYGRLLDETLAREAISSNVCRCTGYTGIVAAMLDVAANR